MEKRGKENMKEYVSKQLEEQIGKMIDDIAQGNFSQVEQRFGAVESFILQDEKRFIDGIRNDEKTREKEMKEIREKFVKAIEVSLEHESTDDKVMGIVQAFDTLQGTEQTIMGKYINDLVESVVSYKREIIDGKDKPTDNPAEKTTPRSTDDMDEFLKKNE